MERRTCEAAFWGPMTVFPRPRTDPLRSAANHGPAATCGRGSRRIRGGQSLKTAADVNFCHSGVDRRRKYEIRLSQNRERIYQDGNPWCAGQVGSILRFGPPDFVAAKHFGFAKSFSLRHFSMTTDREPFGGITARPMRSWYFSIGFQSEARVARRSGTRLASASQWTLSGKCPQPPPRRWFLVSIVRRGCVDPGSGWLSLPRCRQPCATREVTSAEPNSGPRNQQRSCRLSRNQIRPLLASDGGLADCCRSAAASRDLRCRLAGRPGHGMVAGRIRRSGTC